MTVKIDLARLTGRLKLIGISKAAASRLASPRDNPDLIRDLERGKTGQTRLDTALALAEVAECDLEYLIGEQDVPRRRDHAEPQGAAAPQAMITLSDDELELIALVRRKPSSMGQVLEITRTLTRENEDTVDQRGRRRARHG